MTIQETISTPKKYKWEEKQFYGNFKRQTSEVTHKKIWTWLRKENFKRKNDFLQIAAQKRHMDHLCESRNR